MKPVDQTKLHTETQTGNCMCAALASILEIDIEAVPHFEDMDDTRWWPALRNWLEGLGFQLLTWDGDYEMEGYYLGCGISPRNLPHMVVYKGSEMVHDPHPSRAGIEKKDKIWVLIPHDPARFK